MPKTIFFFISVLLSFCSLGQEVVDWTVRYDSEAEVITLTAEIEEHWHMYSQKIDPSLGPVATSFHFEANKKSYKLNGKTVEPTPITEYDKTFEGELSYFEHSVQFVQKLKVKSSAEISGHITFMVCNDEMCLPPTDFEFNLMITKNEK